MGVNGLQASSSVLWDSCLAEGSTHDPRVNERPASVRAARGCEPGRNYSSEVLPPQ